MVPDINLIFPDFLVDASSYKEARAFWEKQMDAALSDNQYLWEPFYTDATDGNPLFSAYVPALHKLVRIIAFLPESDDILFMAYLDQWPGTFPEGVQPSQASAVPELVIDLAMTESTLREAKKLLYLWLHANISAKDMQGFLEMDEVMHPAG